MCIAKKYFLFQGVDRKKTELKRVRIAKKNHSSLLSDRLFIGKRNRGQETVLGYLGIGNMNDRQARGVVWMVIDGGV